MKKSGKWLRIFALAAVVFIMIMIFINPERYVKSAYNGLILFAAAVLPSLFPFFFFSSVLTYLGAADSLARVFGKAVQKLYKAPSATAYIFIMSLLSGYPVGAKLIADFHDSGRLTHADCKKAAAFCSTSGPLFILGTVAALLHNKPLAYIILTAHILSAFLNGFLYRGIKGNEAENSTVPLPQNTDNILSKSITSSLASIFAVGGYITIFSVIADILFDTGVISFFAAPLEFVIMLAGGNGESVEPMLISAIEMTRGLVEIAKLNISIPALGAVTAAAVSFGGLSVTLQSLTFLSRAKVGIGHYLLTKTTQAVIAFFIALFLGWIFF